MALLRFPPRCQLDNIQRFLDIEKEWVGGRTGKCSLDFSKIVSLDAVGTCYIAKVIHHISKSVEITRIIDPVNSPSLNLQSCETLRRVGKNYLSLDNPFWEEGNLHPVLSDNVRSTRDLFAIIDKTVTSRGIRDVIWETISELTSNVLNHAQNLDGAFACVLPSNDHTNVEIAVLDGGVGMLGSFRRPLKVGYGQAYGYAYGGGVIKNDLAAIQMCLQHGVSSLPDKERGVGLFEITQVVRELNGRMDIVSGGAIYTLTGGDSTNSRLTSSYNGTLVTVTLPTKGSYKPRFADWENGIQ